nr:hypothetical protein 27 [bacterium]
MTQEALAALVGTSRQQIMLLENGKYMLHDDWLVRLTDVLHCTAADIYDEQYGKKDSVVYVPLLAREGSPFPFLRSFIRTLTENPVKLARVLYHDNGIALIDTAATSVTASGLYALRGEDGAPELAQITCDPIRKNLRIHGFDYTPEELQEKIIGRVIWRGERV